MSWKLPKHGNPFECFDMQCNISGHFNKMVSTKVGQIVQISFGRMKRIMKTKTI